jgi:hypothetical protein
MGAIVTRSIQIVATIMHPPSECPYHGASSLSATLASGGGIRRVLIAHPQRLGKL